MVEKLKSPDFSLFADTAEHETVRFQSGPIIRVEAVVAEEGFDDRLAGVQSMDSGARHQLDRMFLSGK
ncbi:MAG: hypothetical protein M0Z66_09915 [Thermaerobacter sp.]|nr:hypothetical protein [Thermaerobacter sp.]